MDQAILVTPALELALNVIDYRYPSAEKKLRQCGGFLVKQSRSEDWKAASVLFGPNGAAMLKVKWENGCWMIDQITLNLPHWVYGHNGLTIADHETFLNALQCYHEVASIFVKKTDVHRLLPGLGSNNPSYWSTIEFPVHVPDDGGRLLRAWRSARHPSIESEPETRRGSVVLSGTHLRIKAYDKEAQMWATKGAQRWEGLDPFLRLEVRFGRGMLGRYLGMARDKINPDTYRDTADDGPGVRGGFSHATLRKAFEIAMSEVKGVFVPDTSKEAPIVPTLLAAISWSKEIPLQELVDLYRLQGGRAARTIKNHARQAAGLYAQQNGLRLADYLRHAEGARPGVSSDALETARREYVLPDNHVSKEIRSTYCDENSPDSVHWRPSLSKPSKWEPWQPEDRLASAESSGPGPTSDSSPPPHAGPW